MANLIAPNLDEIDRNAQHTIFVEGDKEKSLDPVVIKTLLENNGLGQIQVEAMGSCDNIKSAAQALAFHHPTYYFLIDRDDRSDQTVTDSWNHFPDPNKYNILIWPKRELENYFIDPAYLKQSKYLTINIKKLEEKILEIANQRLFLEAANLTLLWLHRETRDFSLKPQFRNCEQFKTQKMGQQELINHPEISPHKTKLDDIFKSEQLQEKYENFIEELSGGQKPLTYDKGTWLAQISGKEIFNQIINNHFKLTGTNRRPKLQEIGQQVAKQLLLLPLAQQPTDFQDLVNKLKEKVLEL